MEEKKIKSILNKQRKYFAEGNTLTLTKRRVAIQMIHDYLTIHEDEFIKALKSDLGKSATESFMTEIGLAKAECTHMLKNMKKYSKKTYVKTAITNQLGTSYVLKQPYGNVLIMSPWNYPLLLSIDPLVDALAAGNTVMLKPSAYSPATTKAIEKMIKDIFIEDYVAIVTGGREENKALLKQKFDYIFFTGSYAVGKEVMKSAAKYLTPVTLELGGKSPVVVDETANIKMTAKRLVFAKYLNCGQTCVAPDYILCAPSVKEQLIEELKKQIKKQFGERPFDNENYGKMINQKHFDRVKGLIDQEKVAYGGLSNEETLQIEPTVMDNVTWDDAVMKEEIFGPVLPILTYESLEEAVKTIEAHPHPLACYVFTRSSKNAKYVTTRCRFGGGCINDAVVHMATSETGFGGFGESGMGAYHGKVGFDTFTHQKSIHNKALLIDMPMRYQPYKQIWDKAIRMFLK